MWSNLWKIYILEIRTFLDPFSIRFLFNCHSFKKFIKDFQEKNANLYENQQINHKLYEKSFHWINVKESYLESVYKTRTIYCWERWKMNWNITQIGEECLYQRKTFCRCASLLFWKYTKISTKSGILPITNKYQFTSLRVHIVCHLMWNHNLPLSMYNGFVDWVYKFKTNARQLTTFKIIKKQQPNI